MAFNVMARNCDDHSKNFAFLLRQGGAWEQAPAYDLTHAYNPQGAWTFQHLLGVNGKFAGISRVDLLRRSLEELASTSGPRALKKEKNSPQAQVLPHEF